MPRIEMTVLRKLANRRWRTLATAALASLAFQAVSLASAEAAPTRKHERHQQYGYDAKAANARVELPASGWISSKGKTIEVFGHKIDVP